MGRSRFPGGGGWYWSRFVCGGALLGIWLHDGRAAWRLARRIRRCQEGEEAVVKSETLSWDMATSQLSNAPSAISRLSRTFPCIEIAPVTPLWI
jgi:hypothetical protein